MLNLLGFPATVENHYTVGGSYAFSKMTSVDVAYAYAAEVDDTQSVGMFGTINTKHSQDSVSVQLNFNF